MISTQMLAVISSHGTMRVKGKTVAESLVAMVVIEAANAPFA